MGTNFYWYDEEREAKCNKIVECILEQKEIPPELKTNTDEESKDSVKVHIGKRSGVGHYCDDCGVVLCDSGSFYPHDNHGKVLDKCPCCKTPAQELKVTYSFLWTMMSHYKKIKEMAKNNDEAQCIIDENDILYTAAEFLKLVKDCKVWNQWCAQFE